MQQQHRLTALGRPALLRALGVCGLGVAALTASGWSAGVRAQSDAIDIQQPAQPLGDALAALGARTGLLIGVDANQLRGLQAPPLSGRYTAEAALKALLAGSGFEAVRGSDGAYTLRKLPTQPGITQLDAVKIQANAENETATGRVQGVVAKRTATGTKTDTPLLEVAQSISVVTADELALLKPQSLKSALVYTAGVGVDGGGVDLTGDSFVLRGFRALAYYNSIYRNGMKFTVNIFDGQQEPYGLERIEILKGASSLLYGTAAPGGIINTVSKQPTLETIREVNLDVGSFDRKQASADFSGALTQDGEWSGRLTLLARDADNSIDHIKDDRLFAAPTIRWQPNENTSLTLLSYWQRDDSAYVYGYSADLFFAEDSLGPPKRGTFYGQPGPSDYQSDRYVAGYLFDHRFSDTLRLRHALSWYKAVTDYGFVDVYGIEDDHRTGLRYAQTRADRAKALTSDTSLEMAFETGLLTHRVLAGFDTTRQDFETARYTWDIGPIDLYAPTYDSEITNKSPNAYSGVSRATRYGVYVQDQAKLGSRWVLVGGGRQEWSEYTDKPFFSPDDYEAVDEKDDAFTWRTGLVFLAGNGIAPFVSYSTSYEPTPGRNRQNERFKPSEGEQYEVGIRYVPDDARISLSAAVYELTQKNVLTPDPLNASDPLGGGFSVQTGEVRSRGVELEARAQFSHGLSLIGAYSYTDAKTTRSNTPEDIGQQTIGIPYHLLSLWAGYDFAVFGQSGFSIGSGARYSSERPSSWSGGDFRMPHRTLIDAVFAYAQGPWRFALNGTNLADKDYLDNCNFSCTYVEPRRVIGTLSYRW